MATNKKRFTGDLSALNSEKGITPAPNPENLTANAPDAAARQFAARFGAAKSAYGEFVGELIQKCRQSYKLKSLSKADEKKAAKVWIETFIIAGIPFDALNDCYKAAKLKRIDLQNSGDYTPPLSDEFIAAQWKATVKEKYFAARASSQIATPRLYGCPDCFGNATGRKYKTDENGNIGGLTNEFCGHEKFNESE